MPLCPKLVTIYSLFKLLKVYSLLRYSIAVVPGVNKIPSGYIVLIIDADIVIISKLVPPLFISLLYNSLLKY